MSNAPTTAATPTKKGKGKMMWIVVCVLCIGGGAAVPMFVNLPALLGKGGEDPEAEKKKKKKHGEEKLVSVPFTDAVVNLADDRMTRYLRVKIVLLTDEEHEKELTELITKHKAAMKSWMISHLAGKTLKDVSGTLGVNRTQREMLERFEEMLYPDSHGHGHLKNVLFEEYVVQ